MRYMIYKINKMNTVKIITSDEKEVVLPENVYNNIPSIKNALDGCDYDGVPIKMGNLPSRDLEIIIKFIKQFDYNVPEMEKTPSGEYMFKDATLQPRENEFFGDADIPYLSKLIITAQYLEMTYLIHTICKFIANKLKDNSIQELRTILEIPDDMVIEEEKDEDTTVE
jgi:hypothetical protein